MYSWIVDMALAAYLATDPDYQVRKMAKKYESLCANNKNAKATMRMISESSRPAKIIKVAYDELTR